jgi:hypothetical protein
MASGTTYKSTNTKITRDLPRFQEDMETCEEGYISYKSLPTAYMVYVVPIRFL